MIKQESSENNTIEEFKNRDRIIKAYLSFRGLQKQHIDSYNFFLQVKLRQIMLDSIINRRITTDVDPSFLLEYQKVTVSNPTYERNYDQNANVSFLYPQECRISNLTYASDIKVDIKIYFKNNEFQETGLLLGRIPIMLGCCKCNLNGKSEDEIFKMKECPYDPKGYFIVKGVEKVLLIQEQLAENRIIVENNPKTNQVEATVQSYNLESKSKTTLYMKKQKFYVKTSGFKDIPIFILFKALGVVNEQQIIELIGSNMIDKLIMSFEDIEEHQIYSQEKALTYIGQNIKIYYEEDASKQKLTFAEKARQKLELVFLSHVNCKKYDFFPRALYLGIMVNRLIQALGDPAFIDNRDYYGNKRMKCAGSLMELLFEDKFKTFNSILASRIKDLISKQKKTDQPKDFFKDIKNAMSQTRDIITNGLQDTLGSGNWTIKRFKMERKGVSQLLNRISYATALGMMTKMSSQFEKTRKIAGPRALLGSHWGMICPSDTPDGESCGLVKTLALLAHITNDLPDSNILQILISLGVEDLKHFSPVDYYTNFLVFLNGQVVGLHRDQDQLTSDIRKLRRNGKLNEFVSIYTDTVRKYVSINSDGGRLVRPLIIVKNGSPMLKQEDIDDLKIENAESRFKEFVRRGLIEYLDVNEQDDTYIALTTAHIGNQTTHLEIDQMTILSCVTGLIPFPHHNQSPRNTYQCQMGKQSIGVIGLNQFQRTDTVMYNLIYPQTPLVRTVTMEAIHLEKFPAGHNAMVAVMSYSCYDIEDAIVINKGSLDRGFGRTIVYRRYETECEKSEDGREYERVEFPPENQKAKRFHNLDNDGLARIGSKLNNGDAYSFKVHYNERNLTKTTHPSSLKSHWSYIVDRQIITQNSKSEKIVKTMLRQMRRPELGDKFSSRHGQKGVIGLIVNSEDVPFSETGWCPDLIMNPHGYPSRMTVGKLIELMCGKLGAMEGNFKYGTAFSGENVGQVGEELLKRGYHFQGKDALISGITGEYLDCYVFQGPIFYQRLKHMVMDKIHARGGTGPIQTLTRQPVEGRANDGGQRVGEMERDCYLAYGTSNLIIERLLLSSDPFEVYVCDVCGQFKSAKFCQPCKTKKVYQVRLPYACKLLFQELLAMNIKPKIGLVPIDCRQEYIKQ